MIKHEYIVLAEKYAQESRQRKKHVSFIVDGSGELLSSGVNGFEVPSRYAFMGYRSMHSEVMALMRLNRSCPKVDMNDLHLYNFRFNNANQWRMARPCTICMPWCSSVFKTISYTDAYGDIVRIIND